MRLTVASICIFLATLAQADEYQGRVVKLEMNQLTLAITWRGDLKKGVQVDPPVKTVFTLDPKAKILTFNADEVRDEATKKRIMRPFEYVIIKTEKKDKSEVV